MSMTGEWWRDLLRTLFARPDEVMLDLGANGELLVARIRALLSVLTLLLPLVAGITGAPIAEVLIGLGAAVSVNVFAQVWLALANQRRRYGWLPYATTTYDITMTTLTLAVLHLSDPVAPFNSVVVWCFYLIGITMTDLVAAPGIEDYHRELRSLGLKSVPVFEVDARKRKDVSLLVEALLCSLDPMSGA